MNLITVSMEVYDFLKRNFKGGDPKEIKEIEEEMVDFMGPMDTYVFLDDEDRDPEDQGHNYLSGKRCYYVDYDPDVDMGNFNYIGLYTHDSKLKFIRVTIDLGSAEESYVIVSENDKDAWNEITDEYREKRLIHNINNYYEKKWGEQYDLWNNSEDYDEECEDKFDAKFRAEFINKHKSKYGAKLLKKAINLKRFDPDIDSDDDFEM